MGGPGCPYPVQGYYSGQTLSSPPVSDGMMNMTMYPQFAANTPFSQHATGQQYGQPTASNAGGYNQQVNQQTNQGQAFNESVGSPENNCASIDTTPKQSMIPGNHGTPHSVGPYNQSEPRNFAPRSHAKSFPTPPRFSLEGISSPTNGGIIVSDRPDDPFSSPTNNDRAVVSRALLPMVEESDETSPGPISHGPVAPEIQALRSEHLNRLTQGPTGLPDTEVALDPANFPFIESCSQSSPVSYGVIKIKNIPFATKRSEIIAFLGRNSKILNDNQEPVHIIMERVTSKTLDAYVEFMTLQDAMKAVERHHNTMSRGRLARLGDRPVDVELSSQSSLMKDLFPLASGIFWDGSKPVVQAPIPEMPWKTFKGFVTEEEMTMLVKHVEIPHRSPFSKDCPQRPYECMISTIKKLPWYMSDHITVHQRHAVYNAALRLMTLLQTAMDRQQTAAQEATINSQLMKRLVTAAMLCPGFTPAQKDNISYTVGLSEFEQHGFNQPRFPDQWPHQLALCPKPGIPLDVLEWYIAIIREETIRFVKRKPLSERSTIEATHRSVNGAGNVNFPKGKAYDDMTLKHAAVRELSVIERILHRALFKKN
ncbi:hypothetical protein B0H66DRAFT_580088 [Apodospora peruviana]|uniref:RRM domain-containing protein n=1 Tax=Apodospora peruviana TaxID=516989 RepID=A0AAE0MFY0_9PEZI|nr:hypothetical protein B0H66DRAFT_580088 [Apodospora peruviana]